jgi:hypothetical protein
MIANRSWLCSANFFRLSFLTDQDNKTDESVAGMTFKGQHLPIRPIQLLTFTLRRSVEIRCFPFAPSAYDD